MSNNKEETIEITEEEFPYIPKDLLEKLQDVFDIRKMVWYEQSRDTLMGIQQVISYMEDRYKNQNGDN